jgi:glycogen synthase
MAPVNVALLPSAYAPAVGGVEVLTDRLAHHLLAHGHEVEVWTARSAGDALPPDEVLDGLRVRRFVFTLPPAQLRALAVAPLPAAKTLVRLRGAVREFRPEVLHVQGFSGNGAYAAALSCVTGVPLIVTLQGETVMDDHDIYERSVALRTALRAGLRRAAAVTACSRFVLEDARKRFGLDVAKAEVIFNGVDLEETPPSPVELPFDRYVLGLGRVVHKKGFDLLLEAFRLLAADLPEVGLVIAGDGVERDPLRRRAIEMGLAARTAFPGRLSRGEVAYVMEGAEVFVMPSRVEPFGMVVLESWRAGVPVVVSSHGGASEFVVDGVSGRVVDPQHPSALADAIASLLTTAPLRARFVDEGRKVLGRFSWHVLAEQYEQVYRRGST